MPLIDINKEKEYIIDEYNKAKQKAIALLNEQKQSEKALHYFEYAARIAWKYPILHNFIDDELETHLENYVVNSFNLITGGDNKNKIVFYNGQIVDRGALTEQYLQFFIENNYEVLFIVPDIKKTILGKNILNKIKNNKNIKLYIPTKKKIIEQIKELRNEILAFKPNKAFLHFLPNDVLGFCTFSNTKNIEKFHITHNDHTFWLGKLCSDKFLEFRSFGISIDVERRKISKDKIFHLPFYPINDNIEFKGFPFDRKNKVIGISGAGLYKYLTDPELKYFYTIKKLLNENPDFIFCLCGSGNSKIVLDFIKNNNLEKQFYYLGQRDDFYKLVGNCDILFESYPLKGGLVPLFAIEQNIPVIGIANYNNYSGALEEIIGIENYKQPRDLNDFYKEANKLIKSNTERKNLAGILKNNKLNKKDFDKTLSQIISNNHPAVNNIKKLVLNDLMFLKEYINLTKNIKAEFINEKVIYLKDIFSIKEKLTILIKLIFNKYFKLKRKIVLILQLLYLKK